MNKEEKELLKDKKVKRVYKEWYEILRIIRTYRKGSVVWHFFNRVNPLSYIWIFIMAIFSPFICLFSEATLQETTREIIQALLGESI